MRRDEFPIVDKAIQESVLKALEDVRAEIAEYGSIWVKYTIKGHTDRDIQKTIEDVLKQAKTQVLELIDRKIKEIENDRRTNE